MGNGSIGHPASYGAAYEHVGVVSPLAELVDRTLPSPHGSRRGLHMYRRYRGLTSFVTYCSDAVNFAGPARATAL